MNFALVGPAPPHRGGIAQHTRALERDLSRRHDVTVFPFARLYPRMFFPGTDQRMPELIDTPLPSGSGALDPYGPRSWARVAHHVAEQRPDMVIVQWWHPWFALPTRSLLDGLARRLGGRERVAVLCHNVMPHERVPLQRALAGAVLRRAGCILTHAESEVRRARLVAPAVPHHVVPMPILLGDGPVPAKEQALRQLGLDEGRRWLLQFGHVRSYKGVHVALEALAELPDDVGLLVVGEFYEPEDPLRRRAAELGLGARVRFEPRFVPDREIAAWFAASDAVLLPYTAATQSSVLPLAVRFRRPVVVSDAGGLPEAAAGLGPAPARAGDSGALANAITQVLAAPPPPASAFDAAERRARSCADEIAAIASAVKRAAGAEVARG